MTRVRPWGSPLDSIASVQDCTVTHTAVPFTGVRLYTVHSALRDMSCICLLPRPRARAYALRRVAQPDVPVRFEPRLVLCQLLALQPRPTRRTTRTPRAQAVPSTRAGCSPPPRSAPGSAVKTQEFLQARSLGARNASQSSAHRRQSAALLRGQHDSIKPTIVRCRSTMWKEVS